MSDEIRKINSESVAKWKRDALRAQDEAIRAYFGGKRDGRDTMEILKEAFHAKWSEDETLIEAMLNHKTADLKAENERLRAVLQEARDSITGWASYASDYFKDKHDLDGDLARIDEALAGSPPAEQPAPPSLWLPIETAPREDGKMCLLARRYLPDTQFTYFVGCWDALYECWIDESGGTIRPDFCQPITPPEAGE